MIGISTLFLFGAGGSSGQRAGFLGCVDKCPFLGGVELVKLMREAVMVNMTGIRACVKMADFGVFKLS